jgi:hypothetical protein
MKIQLLRKFDSFHQGPFQPFFQGAFFVGSPLSYPFPLDEEFINLFPKSVPNFTKALGPFAVMTGVY